MSPLLNQLLSLLPEARGTQIAWISGFIAIGGGVLWLGGSQGSRSLATLLFVTIGALLGLRVPGWFGIPIGTWATAIGGALVLGILGYALHRLWVGLTLSLMLAGWAIIAAWVLSHQPTDWGLPPRSIGEPFHNYLQVIWNSLPPQMRHVGPVIAGAGLACGLALGALWSRIAVIVLHSILGVSLMASFGVLAMYVARPSMLRVIPDANTSKLAVIAAMAVFGAIVQWRLLPAPWLEESNVDEAEDEEKRPMVSMAQRPI